MGALPVACEVGRTRELGWTDGWTDAGEEGGRSVCWMDGWAGVISCAMIHVGVKGRAKPGLEIG
jgi:hypothetical protein